MAPHLRHSARGLIIDPDGHVLLYRFAVPGGGPVVWCPPGGGVEPGESVRDALARELVEETGLTDIGDPLHLWHQVVEQPGLLVGWDGVINDYFLVQSARFEPQGSLGADQLAAELVGDFRWWHLDDLAAHEGPELFSPRELPRLLDGALRHPPPAPVTIGL
ncbi:NUDIX domain-containing protein [Propionibacteriaceae bacterium Y2011]|uniref:NUDIX domain-containing protein n=1 Tax=Microlunatus sp. Y2014 TaxID=3418488 RepID=UPI003B4C9FA3